MAVMFIRAASSTMNENGEPLSAEPEKLGPGLRGKSLAEIAAVLMNTPVTREDGIDQPPSRAPHEGGPSTPEGPEPSAIADAPPTTPGTAIAASPAPCSGDTPVVALRATTPMDALSELINAPSMAPGIGGRNIDLPPPRARPTAGDIVTTSPPTRCLPDPHAIPNLPIRTGRKTVVLGIGGLLFVLGLSTIGVDFGATLLTFLDAARKQVGIVAEAVTPPVGLSGHATSAHPPRLVVENQVGFANEPLPFGISLNGVSGGESLTLAGLVVGTKLSVGTPVGLSGWLLSARDIDDVVAYAPKDFVGVMNAAIDLRSASDQLVDSQVVRLEWVEKKERRLTRQADPSNPPPVIQPPLDPEEVAILLERAENFLKSGDIASARILLKRAANAGNAQAALELGMTFDPALLVQRGVLGLAPDAAQAREWYDKAMKLGSTEALRHLARLVAVSK